MVIIAACVTVIAVAIVIAVVAVIRIRSNKSTVLETDTVMESKQNDYGTAVNEYGPIGRSD